MAKINAAVGETTSSNVKNYWQDVYIVQSLLKKAARKTGNGDYDPILVDGIILPFMSRTVSCIRAFQSRFMGSPDGVISPSQTTISKLSEFEDKPVTPDPPTPGTMPVDGAGCSFPLRVPPPDKKHWRKPKNYNYRGRYFGAVRWSTHDGVITGYRKHAGVDLITPYGTPIYAVAKGTMGPYISNFRNKTGAITVIHKNFICRYGETTHRLFYKEGDEVEQGAQIGEVGWVGKHQMLHFEMFSETKSAYGLTDTRQKLTEEFDAKTSPFMRRKDLIDPSPYLDMWKSNLP